MLGGLAFTPPFADTLSFSRCHFLIVMLLACGAVSRKSYKNLCKITFFTPGRGGQCEKKSVQNGPRHGSHGPGGGVQKLKLSHVMRFFAILPSRFWRRGRIWGPGGTGAGRLSDLGGLENALLANPSIWVADVALGVTLESILGSLWGRALGRSSQDLGTLFARSCEDRPKM